MTSPVPADPPLPAWKVDDLVTEAAAVFPEPPADPPTVSLPFDVPKLDPDAKLGHVATITYPADPPTKTFCGECGRLTRECVCEAYQARLVKVRAADPPGSDELLRDLLDKHRLTTSVQCRCGWRETDVPGSDWADHAAAVIALSTWPREADLERRVLNEAADDLFDPVKGAIPTMAGIDAWLRARAAAVPSHSGTTAEADPEGERDG